MAKKESSLLNMVLTLFVITLVSGVALGFVNELTLQPKANVRLAKQLDAIKAVVPQFDNNPTAEMYKLRVGNSSDSLECYPAKINGQLVGTAIISETNTGFNGTVRLMVGINPDGSIYNISILEQKETPGLGTEMEKPKFKDQFNGKNPSNFKIKVKKDGGDVDAITAATISSRAFCRALAQAVETFNQKADATSGATKSK